MLKSQLVLVSTVALIGLSGCGGGGSSSGGGSVKNVEYTLSPTPGVTCPNADSQSGSSTTLNCRLSCAVNNITTGATRGVTGVWSITFNIDRNGLRELSGEGVSTPCVS